MEKTVPPEIMACFNYYQAGKYEKSIQAGRKAIKKYPEEPLAYYRLGLAYCEIKNFKLAYENLKKAESLTNNKKILLEIYIEIGKILENMGSSDDALLYFNKSLHLIKDLENIYTQAYLQYLQAGILNNIANIYNERGELDKALNYYEEALSLQTNEKEKAIIYNNIAFVYDKKGDFPKAIEYSQKAIQICKKYKNYRGISICQLNLGDTYREMKDYENAKKYILKGLKGIKETEDKYWEAYGYWYLGRLHRDKENKKMAEKYFTRAYNLFQSIGAEEKAQSVLNEMKKIK